MPLAKVTTKIPNLDDLVGFVGCMCKVDGILKKALLYCFQFRLQFKFSCRSLSHKAPDAMPKLMLGFAVKDPHVAIQLGATGVWHEPRLAQDLSGLTAVFGGIYD